MSLSKSQRADLRGMFGGKCAYCGIPLGERWHADHVEAVYRQPSYVRRGFRDIVPEISVKARLLRPNNDCYENLFPACIACNIDKGVESIEDWRLWLQGGMVATMRNNIANFRHAERFGHVMVINEPIVFWFEKYQAEHTAEQREVLPCKNP